jgi:hypothetical protein
MTRSGIRAKLLGANIMFVTLDNPVLLSMNLFAGRDDFSCSGPGEGSHAGLLYRQDR